jgi:nucleoside-diphosphate-sugar epimerase
LPLPSDDPKDREPDISKAKNLLNWEPSVSREVGLSKTIQDVIGQLALN